MWRYIGVAGEIRNARHLGALHASLLDTLLLVSHRCSVSLLKVLLLSPSVQ